MEKSLRLIISSELKNVSILGLAVQGACKDVVTDEITLYQIQLCVVELINNIIMHAYHQEGNHQIEVNFKIDQDEIRLEIMDSGIENLNLKTPFQSDQNEPIENLEESGRGVFIVSQLMDEFKIQRENGMNITSISKKLTR